MAVLLLAGILAVAVCKTRTQGGTIRDPAEKNARDIRHQGALADVYAAKAHVAQVEVDVKTTRARRLRQQAGAEATNREPTGGAAVARGRLTATTRRSGANRSQPIDTSWSIESLGRSIDGRVSNGTH